MEFIGSGLGDDVDQTAAVTAVLGTGVIGDDAKLSDGVQGEDQEGAFTRAFNRVRPIHLETAMHVLRRSSKADHC